MTDQEPALTFSTFVFSLMHTTAVHLGDAADPHTGEAGAVNLDAAQHMIDILGLLEEKTRGNLTAEERQLLEQGLYTLRMRFLEVQKDGREPQSFLPQDAWMAALSDIPMLYQPGDAWLYDTCSVLQGVLVSRVSGQSLPAFLADRIFQPLGMDSTGFVVPARKLERLTSYYKASPDGSLELADGPDGQWSTPPPIFLGNGGLAGTADDWLAFARMLLAGGTTADGRRLLSADSVQLMINDHTTPAQRAIGQLFLEGQGWGFGGSVDIASIEPWNVEGRYGWVGGTGTSAHITPSTETIAILFSQVAADGPTPPEWMRAFWQYAAGR